MSYVKVIFRETNCTVAYSQFSLSEFVDLSRQELSYRKYIYKLSAGISEEWLWINILHRYRYRRLELNWKMPISSIFFSCHSFFLAYSSCSFFMCTPFFWVCVCVCENNQHNCSWIILLTYNRYIYVCVCIHFEKVSMIKSTTIREHIALAGWQPSIGLSLNAKYNITNGCYYYYISIYF